MSIHKIPNAPALIVRQARKLLQLNQNDFANRFNKSQGVLSRYETGAVSPPSDIIMHCMHILQNDAEAYDIENLIEKIKLLEGEKYSKLREALSAFLDKLLSQA